jgi:ubiquinone/menaquinone biosynthesis C-methylase UbiE
LDDDSVDFVYSNQLMEHLHPDDAREQLREIRRILKRGGRYFCITPNANSGPHDISMFFDSQATGFHLKEYSYGSLAHEMRMAGFESVTPVLVHKRKSYRIPLVAAHAVEIGSRMAERLLGPSLRWNPKVRALLGVNMLAVK